jgi:YVTN family beta-propeller protein
MKRTNNHLVLCGLGAAVTTMITCSLAIIPAHGIAQGTSVEMAFVSNSSDNTVSMVSLDSFRVVNTIPVGSNPYGLVLTPDGSRLYVANYSSANVSVIDTYSHSVIATILVGTSPRTLAVSRDGARVFVVNYGSASMSVISTASNTVVDTVTTAGNPSSVAYHPVRDEIWLGFNASSPVLLALTGSDYSVIASAVDSQWYASYGLQFSPDGNEAYAAEACGCCGRFHVISGSPTNGTFSFLEQDLLMQSFAIGVAVDPVSGTAYGAQQGQAECGHAPRICDITAGQQVLVLPQHPQGLAVAPKGGRLCIAEGTNTLQIVDVLTWATITNIVVGTVPQQVVTGLINQSPSLTVAVSDVQVCWNSASNVLYQVEYRSALTTNTWQPLEGQVVGNGSTNCISDSILGQPARFYRVRVVQ